MCGELRGEAGGNCRLFGIGRTLLTEQKTLFGRVETTFALTSRAAASREGAAPACGAVLRRSARGLPIFKIAFPRRRSKGHSI
jgi:hypothetical protein